MLIMRKKQQGVTLVELLISMSISLVVIAGALGLFLAMIKNSRQALDAGRLDRELHSAMSLMIKDVRRAGFWGNAQTSNNNPFAVTGSTDLTIVGGNCMLFTYDANADGILPTISSSYDDERYGYRLVGGALQFRPAGASYDCAAASNVWDNLTDPNATTITALSFTQNNNVIDIDGSGPGTATNTMRDITITLTGQLANDSTISKTITRTVRIYNDKYTP